MSPMYRLWRRERDRRAAVEAELRRVSLALQLTQARLRVATDQRDRAWELAEVRRQGGMSAADRRWLHERGIEA